MAQNPFGIVARTEAFSVIKFLFETVDLKDRPRAEGVADFAFATHPTCNGDTR